MRSPAVSSLFRSSSPDNPPADFHNKLQTKTPYRSKTDTINSIVRTFSASKALNQILGIRDPEPFTPPPAMPNELKESFETGLQGYEQVYTAGVFASRQTDSRTASIPSQQAKAALADILEEKESPVRASQTRNHKVRASSDMRISVPKWTSGKLAVATARRYTDQDSDSDEANDTIAQQVDYEFDEDFGSSTTLAASDCSQPGSAGSGPSLPPLSFPPRTSSLLPLSSPNMSGATTTAVPGSTSMRLRPAYRLVLTPHRTPAPPQHSTEEPCSYPHVEPSSSNISGSFPVAFLSPDVASAPGESVHKNIAHQYASRCANAGGSLENDILRCRQNKTSSPTPRILIQASPPAKPAKSRKHAPPSPTQEDSRPSLAQRPRRDNTCGLPVLPAAAEADWKRDFPGNTPALLTILLTWSHTMWVLHRRLHDPKLFSTHAAFPSPVTPPVRKHLLSVGFYDTSVEPHKEVRFLGPGDAAEMSYHQVDVFEPGTNHTHGHNPASAPSSRCNSPVEAIKQTLGLGCKEPPTHTRSTSMSQRAKTRQVRWSYVLVKAAAPPDRSTPPHVILAWPATAVTFTTDCLHMMAMHAHSAAPRNVSALQNPGRALRSSSTSLPAQTPRTASSIDTPNPGFAALAPLPHQGGVALHRTVLQMQRAGGIPLVEGYRVDCALFRGWMEACGRGEGKVIMWRERDG